MPVSPFNLTEQGLKSTREELRACEPIFHRPLDSSNLAGPSSLMASGYWEVGASGRRYSEDFIREYLAARPPEDAAGAGWHVSDFACREVAEGVYLVTYGLAQGNRRTRRATIWKRSVAGWQALYHQGTIITSDEDDAPPKAAKR